MHTSSYKKLFLAVFLLKGQFVFAGKGTEILPYQEALIGRVIKIGQVGERLAYGIVQRDRVIVFFDSPQTQSLDASKYPMQLVLRI